MKMIYFPENKDDLKYKQRKSPQLRAFSFAKCGIGGFISILSKHCEFPMKKL